MKLNKLKTGDKAFGAIPTYNGAFQKGWKVKKLEVIRISPYNIWVSFDKYTIENPQRLRKAKKTELIQLTEDEVWENIIMQEKDNYYLQNVPSRLKKKYNIKRVSKSLGILKAHQSNQKR